MRTKFKTLIAHCSLTCAIACAHTGTQVSLHVQFITHAKLWYIFSNGYVKMGSFLLNLHFYLWSGSASKFNKCYQQRKTNSSGERKLVITIWKQE